MQAAKLYLFLRQPDSLMYLFSASCSLIQQIADCLLCARCAVRSWAERCPGPALPLVFLYFQVRWCAWVTAAVPGPGLTCFYPIWKGVGLQGISVALVSTEQGGP